ncbi:NADase-type glycan-binding domain-containing protein [Nocardioides hwasunensis]|uniref:NAD glycohydrolase translocation F5/8 type C domain-containing protein n=1 Tax=Nocardioides hwasunensis TaxID=397258 RepID=A0ABR8MFB7_9ACTN|nr:hypothetical protein [Nocardioides hwasunensis]MBD3913432.1 hypothetical protein [Nocardioides hwasunensis]
MPVQAADPTPVPPTVPPDAATDPAPTQVTPAAVAAGTRGVPATSPRPRWDPEEELLPYEEVDGLEPDYPVRGRTWIFWVVGAALLVGLVVVLLQVFTTGDEDTAADPAGGTNSSVSAEPDPSTPEETEADPGTGQETDAPAGAGQRVELATGATFEVPDTAPPTQDFDGTMVAYEAAQMGDGNPSTAWRTEGDATGQSITITLPEAGVVQRVGLVNGYAKQVAGVDWYPNNRRILAVTWTFDDGTAVTQTLAERPELQTLKVPQVETSTVVLSIDSVTPPGSGSLGRDYTAISEVSIIGRAAG